MWMPSNASVVFLVLVTTVHSGCPPPSSIVPCVCNEKGSQYSGTQITCSNLYLELELETALHGTKGYDVFTLKIVDSSLRFLPNAAFKGTVFKYFEMWRSSLATFSESEFAFQGLEKSLVRLTLSRCTFANDWNWSQLRKIEMLREIYLVDSDLLSIPGNFKEISHLPIEFLTFSDSSISWLADDVFSGFKKLYSLTLNHNLITELKRSMFPKPALELNSLDLSNNQLQTLPDDIFVQMPALKILNLSANKFSTLEENAFQPVWSKLVVASLEDLPLVCDCRLAWIAKGKSPTELRSKCRFPERLKNKELTSLTANELWC